MVIRKKKGGVAKTSVSKNMEELEASYFAVRDVKLYSHFKQKLAISKEVKSA